MYQDGCSFIMLTLRPGQVHIHKVVFPYMRGFRIRAHTRLWQETFESVSVYVCAHTAFRLSVLKPISPSQAMNVFFIKPRYDALRYYLKFEFLATYFMK